MNIATKRKIVLLGMMSKMPVAGNAWLAVQYLIGFQRLGYDVYYVEAHGCTPRELMEHEHDDGHLKAARYIERILRRFDLQRNWAYHARHAAGEVYGMTRAELNALYRSAEVIINLHGGTEPLVEHSETSRLIYLGTDPVEAELEVFQGVQKTIDFLSARAAFFTWGLNYGQPGCKLPDAEHFAFRPSPPPVICDFWATDARRGERFTTIGNWRQLHRDVLFQGEVYHWSKHHEYLKILDLPRRTLQKFELALSSCNAEERRLLEDHGWHIRAAMPFSADLDGYRNYLAGSRGEFTVAKDQNVRLRTGWFSERSAQYLASGRPVITQDTAFGSALPTGDGLFAFSSIEDILAAVDAINSDYDRHCRAAATVARELLNYEVVLKKMLEEIGACPKKNHGDASVQSDDPASHQSEPCLDGQTTGHMRRSDRVQAPLRLNGSDDYVILASCLGDQDTGGGLFAYDGAELTEIDRLSSTGLCATDQRLFRLLRSATELPSVGELLVYDCVGVERYHRIDALADAHDIAWTGTEWIAVSTLRNQILWLSASGEVIRAWQAPGDGDAWHLNSLLLHEDQIYVSAFGRFRSHREWGAHQESKTGIVFNLKTGKDVLSGLSCPHHPRFFDGAWGVCNSARHELIHVDASTGLVRQRLALDSWTRGLAVTDDYLFVGESAQRRGGPACEKMASIAVICRRTWRLMHRLPLPCREIYDLVVAPRTLLNGLKTGFATNTRRVAEQSQYELFREAAVKPLRLWATGDPLPAEACRVEVMADIPQSMPCNRIVEVRCTIVNRGGAILLTAPPHAVSASYKWRSQDPRLAAQRLEGLRTPLERALPPGEVRHLTMKVQTPSIAGEYQLRLTLVQEHIAWFDDLADSNFVESTVRVTASDTDELNSSLLDSAFDRNSALVPVES